MVTWEAPELPPLPMDALNEQLHVEQFPPKEIQKLAERFLYIGQTRRKPTWKWVEKE